MDMESGGASVFGRNPLASFHDDSPTSRVGFHGEGLFSYFSTFTYLEFLFAHITFDVLSFIFYYFPSPPSTFSLLLMMRSSKILGVWSARFVILFFLDLLQIY